MRFSLWSVLAVVLMTAVAVAAQESTEKQAASPKQSKQTSDEKQAEPSDENPEAPADEKPAKKAPAKKGLDLKITTDEDEDLLKTFSYMQGFGVGQAIFQQFTEQGIHLDEEVFIAALREGLAGKEPTMTDDERKNALTAIQKYMSERMAAHAKEQAARNKEEGAAFLAQNKKKEGVKVLPSGLQYKVLKTGKGESPKKTDTVKVHYKGILVSGKEFDNSQKANGPVSFPLTGLVKGMAEGLQLMKVGDKWQLVLPSELAFGEQGRQGSPGIPPNAVLVFEVELVGIEKAGKTPALPPTLK
ncbi:MAG TPA: FKBP-type peptidyl-prolyl cis-trans isomerase [Pirellulales bacterium]|jgi:FKBP-type peptidyl-prolyl cis-trans isomerase FklB|nr:FKBP-type peptidyl-prolyl cis-trans isomerase [Pirellulales bacterium]